MDDSWNSATEDITRLGSMSDGKEVGYLRATGWWPTLYMGKEQFGCRDGKKQFRLDTGYKALPTRDKILLRLAYAVFTKYLEDIGQETR